MDKLYEINFSQTFEETRTVRASSQDDAIEKLKDVWDVVQMLKFLILKK